MVSFWIAPEARGQSVAAQALWLLAGWAFGSLGLTRLELFIDDSVVYGLLADHFSLDEGE